MVYEVDADMKHSIVYWLFLAFVIWITIEVLRKAVGGSLGFEEVMTALLVVNVGLTYRNNSKLSEHLGWHRGKGDM